MNSKAGDAIAADQLAVSIQPGEDTELTTVVTGAGARIAPLAEADALIWTGSNPADFPAVLPERISWVQLPLAGIENWISRGVIDARRVWTSAAGAYADTVAEHALMLLLAGVRALPGCVRAQSWQSAAPLSKIGTLRGATVTVLGAGGIGRAMIPMLDAVGARVLAVNRRGLPVPGATRTVPVEDLDQVWPVTDHVVVAAPATPATRHLIGAAELTALKPTSWLVNVARGDLVDTDALVVALRAGTLAGAALDVTAPEPLPDGHPLWQEPRAVITPHIANPTTMLRRALAERVAENVSRRAAGRELLGRVDLSSGY